MAVIVQVRKHLGMVGVSQVMHGGIVTKPKEVTKEEEEATKEIGTNTLEGRVRCIRGKMESKIEIEADLGVVRQALDRVEIDQELQHIEIRGPISKMALEGVGVEVVIQVSNPLMTTERDSIGTIRPKIVSEIRAITTITETALPTIDQGRLSKGMIITPFNSQLGVINNKTIDIILNLLTIGRTKTSSKFLLATKFKKKLGHSRKR